MSPQEIIARVEAQVEQFRQSLPPGFQFILFVFPAGQTSALYTSSTDPETAAKVIDAFADQVEQGKALLIEPKKKQ